MEPMRLIDEDKDMREGERKGRKDCKGERKRGGSQ